MTAAFYEEKKSGLSWFWNEEYETSDRKIRWHTSSKPGEKYFHVTDHSADAEGICAVVEREKEI